MTQLTREFSADIEIRADGTGRTVHGILVPYGQVARVSDGGPSYDEEFAPGAFARDLAARAGDYRGVKFLYQHNRTEPIGRAVDLREDTAGLYGSFKISDTARGNEALELLRDGVLDSFSIGFRPLLEQRRGTVTVRTKAALRETSLVTFPAYAGALVAGVRNLTDEDIETSPDPGEPADTTADVRADQPEPTPDPDPAPATPLGGLTPAQRRERFIPKH
jgi:HK97 family phage prohead protease